MAENRFAHGASAGAAGDTPVPLLPTPSSAATGAQAEDEHAFATEAEENAYWQGVADGIRNEGGTVPPRLAARAAKQQLLVPVHEDPPLADPPPGDLLDFAPVPVERRANGWTPQKQRAFVEALADTGVVRAAAARVGMTEQSAGWLRRRADARTFDRACTAALEIGARRMLSIAYERAIEGTIKRHYFHGELKAEERVYDNRLLVTLLSRIPVRAEPDPQTQAVERDWDRWMDAIEQGAPPPAPEPKAAPPTDAVAADPHPEPSPESDAGGFQPSVWKDEGDWLTNCPPPPGFDGYSEFEPGHRFYQRRLTLPEEEYWEQTGAEAVDADFRYDGETYLLSGPFILPRSPENSESLAAAAKPHEERSEASETCGESRPGPDGGSAPAEPDRRRGFADAADAKPHEERSEASETCGESRPGPDGGSAPAEPPPP